MSPRVLFEQDLETLKNKVSEMGEHAEISYDHMLYGIRENKEDILKTLLDTDHKMVDMQRSIEAMCLSLLTRQQPVARDMRLVSAALKVVTDIERIGDHVADMVELYLRMGNMNSEGKQEKLLLKMMEEAKKILEPYGKDAPLLIAVTVLTSMEDLDLLQIGINSSPLEHVLRLAHLTQRAGLDGVVCSPQEVEILRNTCGPDFKLVTPGIRPIGSDFGDQRRVMTPAAAIRSGSDYLVIGRPITQAENPAEVLRSINLSLS